MAESPYSETDRKNIILNALSSINFSDYDTPQRRDLAIARLVSRYTPYLAASSIPQRMLDAVRIYAEVTGFEFEESSQRYLVLFKASNNADDGKAEYIRTDRTDGRDGEFVKLMMRGGDADKIVGRHAVIYKTNEEMKNQNGRTFRVTPFIDFLD